MINKNIAREFQSRTNGDSQYLMIVTNVEVPDASCNQESVIFHMLQIPYTVSGNTITFNKNSLYENNKVKTLTITPELKQDNNDLFYSGLIGFAGQTQETVEEQQSPLSHAIEITDTYLEKEITVMFQGIKIGQNYQNYYNNKPSIIVNIDDEYRSLFKEYTLEWITNINNQYEGVIIHFNNLKSRHHYPIINIIVIGDEL